MNSFISPRSSNPIARWWFSVDRLSLCMMFILAIVGVMVVATASPSVAERIDLGSYHFLKRHLMYLCMAIGVMVTASFVPVKHINRIGLGLFSLAIIGVIWSILGGQEIKGATRWVRVWIFSIQPSEFLKPAFIVTAAWFLAQQRLNDNFPGILTAIILYGLSSILLFLQPDFGMFFVITCVFGMQIFLVGCPLRYIIILVGVALSLVLMAYFTLGHVQKRVDGFLFPETADTYQIDLSKEAFLNGGFIGTGPGQGRIKNQVPDIHSDFIFTAMGEELGFFFAGLFVIALGYLFYRLLSKFTRAETLFVMLAGSGLTFMLITQSFIHMGSTLQLIPSKGMTLPFISYGGSSLLSVGITFGLILALSRGLNEDRKRGTWRHLKGRGRT